MKRFLMLHFGFEPPTPKIMAAWGQWFQETKAATQDMGHAAKGIEISKSGVKKLSLGPEELTGFSILEAESLEAAQDMAKTNPYIHSIRIYEIMAPPD